MTTRREKLARYGMTEADYDRMLEDQGGLCAICRREPDQRSLAIDHDHESGAVRGLLCFPCNAGLGSFSDDPIRVQRALEYLKANGSTFDDFCKICADYQSVSPDSCVTTRSKGTTAYYQCPSGHQWSTWWSPFQRGVA